MKTASTSSKGVSEKARPRSAKPKSNVKASFGKYKGVIVEKDGCWDEDLEKTITD